MIGSRKPPVPICPSPGFGCGDQHVELQELEPANQHVDDDRAGDQAQPDAGDPGERDADPVEEAPGLARLARRRVGRRGSGRGRGPVAPACSSPTRPGRETGARGERRSSARDRAGVIPCAAKHAAHVPAGEREEGAGDQQDRREGVDRLRRTAPPRAPRRCRRSVAASGRAGSRKKRKPSSGFGEKPTDPVTIESMIASPSARAVASTAAATIAGLAARTLIVHRARKRLTPSAAAPSVQGAGPPAGRRR